MSLARELPLWGPGKRQSKVPHARAERAHSRVFSPGPRVTSIAMPTRIATRPPKVPQESSAVTMSRAPANLRQPGCELAGLFQSAEADQGPGKRLLCGILRQLMVPEHVVCHGDQRGIVPLAQPAEAVEIARPGGLHQFRFTFDTLLS